MLLHRLSHRTRPATVPALVLLSLFTLSQVTSGYLVGSALSLNEVEAEATLIFKGEAFTSATVNDDWFKRHSGYVTRETRFKVISVIKGDVGAGEMRFRHYDESPAEAIQMYTPQFYHFEPGRTYIVSAHRTPEGARQTRPAHTMKMDLGVLRCRDDRQVSAKSLRDIYWEELMAMRDSPLPADVVYAIEQLQQMSEGVARSSTKDFSRLDVRNILAGINVPTLVLHCQGDLVVPFDEGRLLAAAIPGARFVPIASRNHLLLDNEPGWEVLLAELGTFLGWEDRANRP